MRTLIAGKRYDTETATCVCTHEWWLYHPNLSGGEPTLRQERTIYRTRNGKLFGYALDTHGYGRNRDGVTGAFTRKDQSITVFTNEAEALAWAELEGMPLECLEKAFPDCIEDA